MSSMVQQTQLAEQTTSQEKALLINPQIVPQGVPTAQFGQTKDNALVIKSEIISWHTLAFVDSLVRDVISEDLNAYLIERERANIIEYVLGSTCTRIATKQWARTISKALSPVRIISKDISATEWEKSLHYSANDVEQLLENSLLEFKIEVNQNNKKWLLDTIGSIVSLYENQYGVKLSDRQRKSLENLALRIAYDRLRLQ
jgi:hypothetical protein